MQGFRRLVAAIGVGGLVAMASASPAAAAGPICPVTDVTGFQAALIDTGCTTIQLAAGSYSQPGSMGSISFNVTHSVTIVGAGAATTTLTRPTPNGAIVSVGTGSAMTLSGVTVRDGQTGISLSTATSSATLSNVVIDNNSGGGINSASTVTSGSGALTVTDSTISNNTASDGGGVTPIASGTLTFNRVLFRGNKATDTTGGGGAIWLASAAATASFTNVTFAGNKANNHGGAIYLNFPGATVNLNNVTMSGNISNDDNIPGLNSGDGGGFAKFGGNLLSKNSVVAGNIDTDNTSTYAPDCIAGVGVGVTNLGNNLVGDPTNCTFDTPPATGNPMLGPLASNGGPSQTMALLTGSPLLNAGNALTPGSGGSACDGVDQRGFPRGGGAGVCDIGAFEAQPVPPAPITSASPPTGQRAAALKKCKKKKSAKKRKKCKKKAKLLPV